MTLLLADESAQSLQKRDVALVLVLGAEVGELGGEVVADASLLQHVHQQVVEHLATVNGHVRINNLEAPGLFHTDHNTSIATCKYIDRSPRVTVAPGIKLDTVR